MQIRQLINDFECVRLGHDDTVLAAVQKMVACKCGSVLIQNAAGKMCGIFTERDLMVRVISKDRLPADVALKEVMTSEVYSVAPSDEVTEVRRELRLRHIRHVPVLEDGQVLAVLSMRDLLAADFAAQRDTAKAMEGYIRGEM
jgi:signal-transduction protein with cAMP-binding, CBS, and nucleotidyltransferase domain